MEEQPWKYQELFTELTEYERQGIPIKMEDSPASPLQVVAAFMVKEDSVYMKDYVVDEENKIKEICFHKVKMNC